MLRKYNQIKGIKVFPVYFNSTTKTVINSKYDLDKSFREILYRIANWVNEGNGSVIESMNGYYVNYYSQLPGCLYIKLPVKLWDSNKGLINFKNNDNKCFLCLMLYQTFKPLKTHPAKADRNMVNGLHYEGIEFPVSKKDYCKIDKILTNFNKFIYNKIKNKNKKYFSRYCSQCFSSKKVMQEHKETCIKLNGK